MQKIKRIFQRKKDMKNQILSKIWNDLIIRKKEREKKKRNDQKMGVRSIYFSNQSSQTIYFNFRWFSSESISSSWILLCFSLWIFWKREQIAKKMTNRKRNNLFTRFILTIITAITVSLSSSFAHFSHAASSDSSSVHTNNWAVLVCTSRFW